MINSFFDLKEHCSLNNEIINNIIINNLIDKFNIYNYNEVLSLTYINIVTLFFKKLNITSTYKSIKEFTFYIKRYLSYKKERKFVLNKVTIILIKEINEKFILEISNNKI
jgi:hypothetical protein